MIDHKKVCTCNSPREKMVVNGFTYDRYCHFHGENGTMVSVLSSWQEKTAAATDIFPGVHEGTIWRVKGSNQLDVVYLIDKSGNVFYDGLNHSGSGGICHGLASKQAFLEHREYVSTMRFNGAYKLYKKERHKHNRLRWWISHTKDMMTKALNEEMP